MWDDLIVPLALPLGLAFGVVTGLPMRAVAEYDETGLVYGVSDTKEARVVAR